MSERIYAWLLSLYPKSFREQYGRAALDLFHDRLGKESKFRLWLNVAADLIVSLPSEYARGEHPAAVTQGAGWRSRLLHGQHLQAQPYRAPQWCDSVDCLLRGRRPAA